MKRLTGIRIYALAVCFVSIITTAITSGFALYNLITLMAPEWTIEPYQVQYLESNEAFINSPEAFPVAARVFERGALAPAEQGDSRFADMTDEEITELRLTRLESQYAIHTRRAGQSLVRQAIIILISSILFYVHWRLARNIGTEELITDED